MSKLINQTLVERYHLDEFIGEGGMGAVYKATDNILRRTVAVKILSIQGLGSEGTARMLREARSVAGLNHPNIVIVHDAGEADLGPAKKSTPFVVMEFVDGQNLHVGPARDLDHILDITRQLCSALAHAHDKGIIHRDLKPENVLLTNDDQAKLVDFGLARPASTRLTTEGTIAGTLAYMAPELALGQEFDGRVDLYSLGVMLYELTTGQLPFTADDPVSIITQHLYAPVVPPRAINSELPSTLETLILRLLAKSPDERPADANKVLTWLETVDTEEPVVADDRERTFLDRIVRGRLVGRESELAELRDLWNRSAAGRGQTVLIGGEPGVGKTRLIKELVTQVEVTGGRALIGKCYLEAGAPYSPFGQIVRRKLVNGPSQSVDLPDYVIADLLKLSPDLWPQFPDIKSSPPLEPQLEQQRLFENLLRFSRTTSQDRPLLLVIEDIHWADSGSLSLTRHLARSHRRTPIMIVATYREIGLDENMPLNQMLLDLNRERLATGIKLSRFNKAETGDLLEALFATEITPDFLDGIYRKTEGNPFFIEEVCKALVESGQLYYENGVWHRPSMSEITIPQSVRITIQSRVSYLEEEYQDTLRLAAVLGRDFDFDALVEASERDEDHVIDALEAAERAQLIAPAEGFSFSFAHALIPTTLVEGVNILRRRRLHRQVAAAIEKLDPSDDESLAYHYGQAGDDEKALRYYVRAGSKAADAYANQEAAKHYRSALNLVKSDEDKAYLHSQLGVVLAGQALFEEASETWRKAIRLYDAQNKKERIAWLYARLARATWGAGNSPLSLEVCQEGLAKISGAPDSKEKADLLHETARAYYFNGRGAEGLPFCDLGLEIAETTGAVDIQAEALITRALFSRWGEPAQITLLEQAIQLCQDHDLLFQEIRARNNIANSYGFQGDISAGREQFRRAAKLARKSGQRAIELFAVLNELDLAIWQGELDYAAQRLAGARGSVESMIDSGILGINYGRVSAMLLFATGDLEKSAEQVQLLITDMNVSGDLYFLFDCLLILSMVLIEGGNHVQAEVKLDEAIGRSYRDIHNTVIPRLMKAALHAEQGDLIESRRLLDETRQEAAQSYAPSERSWWKNAEAYHLAASGRWREANDSFDESLKIISDEELLLISLWKRDWSKLLIEHKQTEQFGRAHELLLEARANFNHMNSPFYSGTVDALLQELDKLED